MVELLLILCRYSRKKLGWWLKKKKNIATCRKLEDKNPDKPAEYNTTLCNTSKSIVLLFWGQKSVFFFLLLLYVVFWVIYYISLGSLIGKLFYFNWVRNIRVWLNHSIPMLLHCMRSRQPILVSLKVYYFCLFLSVKYSVQAFYDFIFV